VLKDRYTIPFIGFVSPEGNDVLRRVMFYDRNRKAENRNRTFQ
jgi:hypothetical protein